MNNNERLNALVQTLKTNNKLEKFRSIYCRWQDEKEYEDWADYVAALERIFAPLVIQVTKRPFGFSTIIDNQKLLCKIQKSGKNINVNFELKDLK